jgi:peptidoglycan hydrolase-like protein with peptidoglycan-binding domain
VSFLGSAGRQSVALFRHRGITATASAAALVVIAGGAFAVTHHPSTNHQKLASVSDSKPAVTVKPKAPPAPPLHVVSVSPGQSKDANGGAPIKVSFSSALAPLTPLPTLSPKIPGSWQVSGATATFTPSYGYVPGTKVTLKIPGGTAGMQGLASSAGVLRKSATVKFTTGSFSTLRLQQVLAELGYLPLTWTADSASPASLVPAGDENAQLSAAYAPPAGSFTFQSGYPSELTSQWKVGQSNMLDQGAIMAFESNEGLTMDGMAGPQVWAVLIKAAAKGQRNPNGYTYALASQHYPETLTVWHDGKVIEHTLANTGIPASNTEDGTFPVYLRYQFNYMKGTNPDGTKYDDPVWWISYFNGGDAVHYFPRPGYGYYQSLGCVEVPWTPAKYVWSYMTYGTLVTVIGPVA